MISYHNEIAKTFEGIKLFFNYNLSIKIPEMNESGSTNGSAVAITPDSNALPVVCSFSWCVLGDKAVIDADCKKLK